MEGWWELRFFLNDSFVVNVWRVFFIFVSSRKCGFRLLRGTDEKRVLGMSAGAIHAYYTRYNYDLTIQYYNSLVGGQNFTHFIRTNSTLPELHMSGFKSQPYTHFNRADFAKNKDSQVVSNGLVTLKGKSVRKDKRHVIRMPLLWIEHSTSRNRIG